MTNTPRFDLAHAEIERGIPAATVLRKYGISKTAYKKYKRSQASANRVEAVPAGLEKQKDIPRPGGTPAIDITRVVPTLDARLRAANSAQERSRRVLIVLIVLSLATIAATYNAYLSWNRHFLIANNWYGAAAEEPGSASVGSDALDSEGSGSEDSPDPLTGSEVTQYAHRYAVRSWIDSRSISIPLIGMRIAVDDASVLAGLAFVVLSLVYRYVVRRQHYTINSILLDCEDIADVHRRLEVYYGIVSNQVFSIVGGTSGALNDVLEKHEEPRREVPDNRSVRKLFALLIFLPVVALFGVLGGDLYSAFLEKPPFRFPHDSNIFGQLDWRGRVKLIGYLTAGIVAIVVTAANLVQVIRYERSTAKRLQAHADRLVEEGVLKHKAD